MSAENSVPPLVITEELQAQLAELTRQAMAQLATLLESLRQAEQQLLPGPKDEAPGTGGPDPLPSGEDGSAIGIWMPIDPPILVLDPPGPPQIDGFWQEMAEPKPQDGVGVMLPKELYAFSRLAVMPVEEIAEELSAVPDDLVPVAAPAAVEVWLEAPAAQAGGAPAAFAAAEELAYALPDLRAGAEGPAA